MGHKENLTILGKGLMKYRRTYKMKQQTLAQHIGCEPSVLSALEHLGTTECQMGQLKNHSWGRGLREYRKGLGLTQAQLAERLGITQPDVSGLERLDFETLQRVSAIVNIHPEPKNYLVSKIDDFRGFAICLGLDGEWLLHISELSYGFVARVSDVLQVGQSIRAVEVYDEAKARWTLSIKKCQGGAGMNN